MLEQQFDLNILLEKVHPSWKEIIPMDELSSIMEKIIPDREFYPSPENIFRCLFSDIDEIKVALIAQDPYHNLNQANGLAFACDIRPSPPSLKNIITELYNDGFEVKSTNIAKWAERGVLLLNTALTVKKNTPMSHVGYWKPIT